MKKYNLIMHVILKHGSESTIELKDGDIPLNYSLQESVNMEGKRLECEGVLWILREIKKDKED